MIDSFGEKLSPGKDFVGIGVGGAIICHGQILLLLRRKPPERDHWTMPGGAVEFGETVTDALFRELKEEIGVETQVIAPLGMTDQILHLEGTHWVSLRFLVDILSGEPKNVCPESHAEMRWFPLDALPENITLTTREAIAAYTTWATRGVNSFFRRVAS